MDFQDRLLSGDLPISLTQLLVLSVLAFGLFFSSFLIEVSIIVESPDMGDVSSTFETMWRAITGIATLLSFVLAIISFTTDEDQTSSTQGPETEFVVEGDHNDLNIHFHVPDRQRGDRPPESPDNEQSATPQEQSGEEDRESEEEEDD